MTVKKKTGFMSIRTIFLLAMSLLIILLALPQFLAGSRLLHAIIYELGSELLDEELSSLIQPIDRRYATLRRIGLEDSITHLDEIRINGLATLAVTRYKDSGSIFVIGKGRTIHLSSDFSDNTTTDFSSFFSQLTSHDQGIIAYHAGGVHRLATFRFYPPWQSYIGLSIDRDELFAAYYKFIRISMIVVAAAVCTAFLFILGMQRLIITPIMLLTRFAEQITGGNDPAPVQGPFMLELATLKDDVTRMVAGLRRQMQETAQQLDIIRQREAELDRALQALATEKEQLAVTLRSIGDGVITTDTQSRVVMLNKVAEELTGWSQQEAAGRPLPEVFRIINAGTGEPLDNPADKVLASGHIIGLASQTVLLARNGSRRHIADSGAPIIDPESRTIGVVLVFRDVTEKLHYEQEILKIQKLESVGVLAGGIAHDFNNILTAILGNITLARRFIDPETKAVSLLDQAEKASLRAKGLTQQLLTFAKGGSPVRKISSIASIIEECAAFVLRGSNVSFSFDIAQDLWLVNIDQDQMCQVIQNMIINARQAMPQGGTISIACSNSPGGLLDGNNTAQDGVAITISDTGIGIAPEVLDKIFDPYFTSKEQGSGLGLAICHSIIRNHGGSISVTSTPGQGTRFTIVLPACREPAAADKAEQQVVLPEQKGIILVMDDEEIVRTVVENILQHLGYRVLLAENGGEAIELYQKALQAGETVDALIMDLTIPGGMGGNEAAGKILRINPDAKVIVASGYSNDPIMANFRQCGFSAAVTKPFQLQSLARTLQQVLGGGF